MTSRWFFLSRALCIEHRSDPVDLIKYAYGSSLPEGMVYQIAAPLMALHAYDSMVLFQRYALAAYKNEKRWEELMVAACDALILPDLCFEAVGALFTASFFVPTNGLCGEVVAQRACQLHADGALSTPQLLALFFNAIAPHYVSCEREKEILMLRRVLYAYNQELSALLYAHLQAHLYAHVTDSAQKLIGEPDPLAKS